MNNYNVVEREIKLEYFLSEENFKTVFKQLKKFINDRIVENDKKIKMEDDNIKEIQVMRCTPSSGNNCGEEMMKLLFRFTERI